MRKAIVLLAAIAVAGCLGMAQAAPVIAVFKSGSDINVTDTTDLFTDFKTVTAANVVQVTNDNAEVASNPAAYPNPCWLNATVAGTSDYAFLTKWDISSIPAGSTITKAQIRLYATSGNYGFAYVGRIVTADWQQGVVTPKKANATTSWVGQPIGAADFTNITAGPSYKAGKCRVLDVTTDLQAMVNGTVPNYGWGLSQSATFATSSQLANGNAATVLNATTAYRPALFVEYVPAPEPTTVILLAISGLALLRRRS